MPFLEYHYHCGKYKWNIQILFCSILLSTNKSFNLDLVVTMPLEQLIPKLLRELSRINFVTAKMLNQEKHYHYTARKEFAPIEFKLKVSVKNIILHRLDKVLVDKSTAGQ